MSDDDYSAGALYQLWQPMIDGAVNADARRHGLVPSGGWGSWYWPDLSVWIDYQGYTSSYTSERQFEGSLNGFDPRASQLHWSKVIPPLWKSWDVLPEPTNLDYDKRAAYDVILKLGLKPDQTGYAVEGSFTDRAFASDINVLIGEVGGMFGKAMITFNHEIASNISYTSQAQGAATGVLVFAMKAEQAVWTTARANLMKTARAAVTAFEQGYPGGGDSGGAGWLPMLSAITGALSLVGGPASPALAAVSTLAGSFSTIGDALGSEPADNPIGGESPEQVCANVTKKLSELNDSISQGEDAIARGCDHLKDRIGGDHATFDLSPGNRPEAVSNDDPRAFLTIDVEYDKLNDIANNTLPGIADGFTAARTALDGADYPTSWDRPGGFGHNPYPSYSGLVAAIQNAIGDTAWKISESADHMNQVVVDFKKTDDWVAQAHRDLVHDTQVTAASSGYGT